jgi:hypothetical protein
VHGQRSIRGVAAIALNGSAPVAGSFSIVLEDPKAYRVYSSSD